MYKCLITLGILSATLSGVLFGSSSASAATIYDGDVEYIGDLILKNGADLNDTRDYSLDWYNEAVGALQKRCDAQGNGNGACTGVAELSQLTQNEDNRWAVLFDPSYNGYQIVWTDDVNAQINLTGLGYGTFVGSSYHSTGILIYNPSGDSNHITANKTHAITAPFYFTPSNIYGHFFFLSNIPINYPPDYEGEIIPDSYNPPSPPLDWTPEISIVNIVDWKIILQDRNFNTFDSVPFTCSNELTPIIQYDLYDNDTDPITKLDTGVFSPTIQYEYQLQKYNEAKEFKFIANYYCGTGEDEPTFSNQTTIYFDLTKEGIFIRETVQDCIIDTFPFVNLDGCTQNMELLLNSLSFGKITFPSWEFNNDGCHTLGTIGDWINVAPNSRTICPQFSQNVRNTVTPFITFIMGATIVGAIATKSSRSVT